METVENDADIGVVGTPHDLPGVAVIVDVAAPGQGLVADAETSPGRALAEFTQVTGSAIDSPQRQRGDAGTYQHEVGSQLAHQVELAFCTLKGPGPLRLRQSFEIAERLEQRDAQAKVCDHPGDVARRSIIGQEVILEDFHAVKADRRDRLELLPQVTTDRNRRYRSLQYPSSPTWCPRSTN